MFQSAHGPDEWGDERHWGGLRFCRSVHSYLSDPWTHRSPVFSCPLNAPPQGSFTCGSFCPQETTRRFRISSETSATWRHMTPRGSAGVNLAGEVRKRRTRDEDWAVLGTDLSEGSWASGYHGNGSGGSVKRWRQDEICRTGPIVKMMGMCSKPLCVSGTLIFCFRFEIFFSFIINTCFVFFLPSTSFKVLSTFVCSVWL